MKTAIWKSLVVLAIAGAGLAAAAGCRAEAARWEKRQWAVARLRGLVTVPLGENAVRGWNECDSDWFDYLDFRSEIGVNVAPGVMASFEYVFARKYGVEIGFVYWYHIIDLFFETEGLEATVEGSPNFIMPTIGANYHFVTDEKKDIYAGAMCTLGVLATGFFTDIDVSKDVALGVTVGMDYCVKGPWSVGGNLMYVDFGEIDFSVLPEGLEGFVCDNGLFGLGHLNVCTATFGVGYRF